MFKDTSKKKTGRVLKAFAKVRGFEVLSNLNLEFKNKQALIDHVLIGNFGVMFFGCLDLKKGEIFPNDRDEKWAVVTKFGKTYVDSPYLRNQNANDVVREIFAKEEVYRVIFENAVVIDCPKSDTQIIAPVESLGIFTPKDLKKYLRKVKFEKDCGVDIKKTVDALRKYAK